MSEKQNKFLYQRYLDEHETHPDQAEIQENFLEIRIFGAVPFPEEQNRHENQDKCQTYGLNKEKKNEKFSLQERQPFFAQSEECGFDFAQLKKVGEKRTVVRDRFHLENVFLGEFFVITGR